MVVLIVYVLPHYFPFRTEHARNLSIIHVDFRKHNYENIVQIFFKGHFFFNLQSLFQQTAKLVLFTGRYLIQFQGA
jgi:hypothetical protein